MPHSTMTIRPARMDDAHAMGKLHIQCWIETYTGLLPDSLLASLSVDKRTTAWQRIIESAYETGEMSVFVAVVDDAVAGLASCSKQRDESLFNQGFVGEFSAIYLLEKYQGMGIGKALMHSMTRDLLHRGIESASLWVLDTNIHARHFYEHLGGTLVGEKQEQRGETLLTEVAYGWHDIQAISS